MTDITALAQRMKAAAEKAKDNFNPNVVVDTRDVLALVEALEKAQAAMTAVVAAASIRGIRPFDGMDCEPPTLEENAEACGDAMSARVRELEANPPKLHHNGLMQLSNELAMAKQRIAELESRTVKLAEDKPAESESEVDDAEAWFDEGWNARGEADRDALAAAGIQVIEGDER